LACKREVKVNQRPEHKQAQTLLKFVTYWGL
jgi:hypothetical protein